MLMLYPIAYGTVRPATTGSSNTFDVIIDGPQKILPGKVKCVFMMFFKQCSYFLAFYK